MSDNSIINDENEKDETRPEDIYCLDEQVGFLLRQVSQRHLSIFSTLIDGLTPTQFAALAKIFETGPISQNVLGRQTAMDAATMKGVIDRLSKRGLVTTKPDTDDLRRILVELTPAGLETYQKNIGAALEISAKTLDPLKMRERKQFLSLLQKMVDHS